MKETIFSGTLISKTPFFFGISGSRTDQNDLQILLTPDNEYRLPRSAIRGILSRDLQSALKTRCIADFGGRPCSCKVCRIMRSITVMDVCNDKYKLPPEIRQRIRINPYTGTVAESALFNMEVAPESLSFPFILRYRSNEDNISDSLKEILSWWLHGQAFMSGAASTGKGRFELTDLKHTSFDLTDPKKRTTYLNNYGWRDPKLFKKLQKEMQPVSEEWKKSTLSLPWQRIDIDIHLSAPFINGDPIRALVEGDGANVISFKKNDPNNLKTDNEIFAYKAESFRGVIRSAVAKIHTQDGKTLSELSHNDCECLLCRLFGSVHETGKIRFEDLVFSIPPKSYRFDHVAIDRFTGGGVDQKKFNDEPVYCADKEQPLVLTGCFWIKQDILEKQNDCQALATAFSDIVNGCHPLGGKTGIGYGVINKIDIKGDLDKIAPFIKKKPDLKKIAYQKPVLNESPLKFNKNSFYYPHYFLKPAHIVDRNSQVIGHQKFHNNLLTGKIVCKLITKTPLIIPDTSDDDAMKLADKKAKKENLDYHKSFRFFSLNEDIMIPGSEIRGMISSIYEAITNSCFRIFDESYRLSWRMEVSTKELEQFKPGRIAENGNRIELMKEYRYPFYDKNITDNKKQDKFFNWDGRLVISSESLKKLKQDGVSNHFIIALKKIENKKYSSQNALSNEVSKILGETPEKGRLLGLIFKHAEGKVSRYEQPTLSDRMILSLANYNRENIKSKDFKLIKPYPKSPDFMWTATPAGNSVIKKLGYDENNKKEIGFLKVSGPNKVDKKELDDEAKEKIESIPDKSQKNEKDIIHQKVDLQKIFVQSSKKKKERDRLIPEFQSIVVQEGKTYQYRMTKHARLVGFLEQVHIKED